MSFYLPLIPSLVPSRVDTLWFNADQPCDDEAELSKLENDYQQWLTKITQKNIDLVPVGKTVHEHFDEDDDDEDNDDDDSESNDLDDDDDDLEVEMNEDHDSHNNL